MTSLCRCLQSGVIFCAYGRWTVDDTANGMICCNGKMVVEVEQIYSTKNPGELIKKLMEPGDKVVEKSHCDNSAYFAWESILWGEEKITYILAKTLDRWDK